MLCGNAQFKTGSYTKPTLRKIVARLATKILSILDAIRIYVIIGLGDIGNNWSEWRSVDICTAPWR